MLVAHHVGVPDEAIERLLPPDQASQQRLPDLLKVLRAITALA
ncbi:hypothetical protein [Cyanobium sp. BA20m-14]|nr:hypothetical protein [Cyanobium sp. BA20m-14]